MDNLEYTYQSNIKDIDRLRSSITSLLFDSGFDIINIRTRDVLENDHRYQIYFKLDYGSCVINTYINKKTDIILNTTIYSYLEFFSTFCDDCGL